MNLNIIESKLNHKSFLSYSDEEIMKISDTIINKIEPYENKLYLLGTISHLLNIISTIEIEKIKNVLKLKDAISDVFIAAKLLNAEYCKNLVVPIKEPKNANPLSNSIIRVVFELQNDAYIMYYNKHNCDFNDISYIYYRLLYILDYYKLDYDKDIKDIINIKIDDYNKERKIIDKTSFRKIDIKELILVDDKVVSDLEVFRFSILNFFFKHNYYIKVSLNDNLKEEKDTVDSYNNFINMMNWYKNNGYGGICTPDRPKGSYIKILSRFDLLYAYTVLYDLYSTLKHVNLGGRK